MQTLHISEEHGAANRKIFRESRLLTVRVCREGYIYEVESVIVLPTQEAIVCGRATRREIYFSWFLQSKHSFLGYGILNFEDDTFHTHTVFILVLATVSGKYQPVLGTSFKTKLET